MKLLTFIFVLISFLTVSALAVETSQSKREMAPAISESQKIFVICRNQNMVRTIRIRNDGEGRCETLYSKGGQDQVVGYGQSSRNCSQFLENIRDNLQDAQWSCREIRHARVLNSLDVR